MKYWLCFNKAYVCCVLFKGKKCQGLQIFWQTFQMLYYIQTVAIKKHFVFSFSIQTFNKDALALSETKKKTVEHMNKLLPHHTINMGKRSHNHLCTSKTV